ncbi:MAG: T9SS type A sorting domain-containing protein [Ignavibacteriales bacterium]|nr:MAG: T9SS type A sorting domain-containing protein [Ignavibacteriales bacterium]
MKSTVLLKFCVVLIFFLFASDYSQAQWQKTNGLKGGYFSLVAGDMNNLLAVTNYGSIFQYKNESWNFRSSYNYLNEIFKLQDKWIGYYSNVISKSEDDGLTWQEILHPDENNFLVSAKVIDNKIYALSSDTLFYSDDFGTTWNANEVSSTIVAGVDTGFFYAISNFYIKDNIMLAGGFTTFPSSFGALAYSTNMGLTWQPTMFPSNINNTFVHDITGDDNYFYASASGGFFKSTNGLDWSEINEGLPFSGVSLSVTKMSIFQTDLIAIINNTPSGLYRYNGTNWSLFYDENFPSYMSTENDELIFTANGEVIKYDVANNIVLTSDIIASTSRPVVSANGNVYSVYKQKMFRSVDNGQSWNVIREPSGGLLVVDGNTLFTTSSSGVVRSTNSGDDWTFLTSGIPSTHIPKLSSVGITDKKIYAGFNGIRARMHLPPVWEQGGVYVSLNNGDSWSALNSGLPTEGGVHTPVYSITANGNIVILNTASGRFSLINNTWVNISNGFPVNVYMTGLYIFNEDIIFLTTNGLYISRDRGITKEEFNTGLPSLTYYFTILFNYENELYVFANDQADQVFKLQEDNWVPTVFPMPDNVRFTELQATGKIIFAGTYDNGIWIYNPSPTDVDDISNPESYSLGQNYPNPFNPSTTISYQLAATGNVEIVVYDVLGKEILTLVNESKPAGNYQLVFDASSLTSGVYFYRIVTNNFIQTRKMILLR